MYTHLQEKPGRAMLYKRVSCCQLLDEARPCIICPPLSFIQEYTFNECEESGAARKIRLPARAVNWRTIAISSVCNMFGRPRTTNTLLYHFIHFDLLY